MELEEGKVELELDDGYVDDDVVEDLMEVEVDDEVDDG